jgi:[glutamine synthetase] adenylyltransferase / [glutamine synthetase]-adenylyl-L-tyrosine phosphorylase
MFKINPLANAYDAINFARPIAPHIERLCKRFPQTFESLATQSPNELLKQSLELAKNAKNIDLIGGMRDLRHAKSQTHLVLTAADLSQTMPLMDITGGLSNLGDFALQSALALAVNDAPDRDKRAFIDNKVPGLFIIAMGKHGAGELNYSSDVDLSAFFERDEFHEDHQHNSVPICVRIIGAVSRIMEEITPDNYVFRVDWRLRPDPASTPLAVTTRFAEQYYESVGQNWERAAFIKARAVAGDLENAQSFLNYLQPFIWRKYLDFAAVQDVTSILRQIHRHKKSGELDNPVFDVKLGRGGIREIEFFTQTQQLILGGKDRNLRDRKTLDALVSLYSAGRISEEICNDLSNCYEFLRNIEHRIQMLDDEQTHSLPENVEKRARIAALSGFEDLKTFDKIIHECRETVTSHIQSLFGESQSLSTNTGSLVFTGVDDDEETLKTLGEFGFKDAKRVSQTIRGWHHGRIRATRTPRAREILTSITPVLLSSIAQTGEADIVFSRFDDFLSGLSAGVQTLSLFHNEPQILRDTCLTLGLSNRLAQDLAKKPAILDAMLSPRFNEPLNNTSLDDLQNLANNALEHCEEFEFALDLIRRFHREEAFRIGYHILHGHAQSEHAAKAFSDLAKCCIRALLPWAIKEVENSHGKFKGQIAICGWGKLGGDELAADSDLDLMIVYEPDKGIEQSDGARALSPESYFAKVTQKLVMALSVQTSEGPLYEVDMQLRPSGKKGPVAVRFSSFENYYKTEAWTWEFQALTRLTPIAGDAMLCEKITKTARECLQVLDDKPKLLGDIINMRTKMRENLKPRGKWDLKRTDGGIIDLEFIAQAHELLNVAKNIDIIDANSIHALEKLGENGFIPQEEMGRLINAGKILGKVRQILAIVSGADFDDEKATSATKKVIAIALEQPDFSMAMAQINHATSIIKTAWHNLEIFSQNLATE